MGRRGERVIGTQGGEGNWDRGGERERGRERKRGGGEEKRGLTWGREGWVAGGGQGEVEEREAEWGWGGVG